MQTSKNLTPTETILFNAINFLIEFGQGKEMILECLTKSLERNEKYRAKKKLENLFSYISNSDKLEENNKSQKQLIESLKTLGIFDSQ